MGSAQPGHLGLPSSLGASHPFVPSQHHTMGPGGGFNAGPGTPNRSSHGLAPSVVISPSVPVGWTSDALHTPLAIIRDYVVDISNPTSTS